jgi:hypothetical protein
VICIIGGGKMNKNLYCKVLAVGIIVLFVGLGVFSKVSSKEVINSSYEINEDNKEIAVWDDNDEIITKISGQVGLNYCTWDGILLKKVEVWTTGNPYSYLEITGYKKPLFPLVDSKFNANPTHIIAERFFGFIGLSNDW